MSTGILVAGGAGVLGREIVARLNAGGAAVAVLSRGTPGGLPGSPDVRVGDVLRPGSLRGVCEGMDVVVSAVGASLDLGRPGDRNGYDRVDHRGNLALMQEAARAGVRRLVYVSVFAPPSLRSLEYVEAHEKFAAALAASGLEHAVIRPTGFFSFLGDLLDMARKGRTMVVGDGTARTNPVHHGDVAGAVVRAIQSPEVAQTVDVGGPEILTRREIVELACRAVRRDPRIRSIPPGPLRAASTLLTPLNRRLSALLRFGTEVSLVDVVAPAVGTRRLEEYFVERASRVSSGPPGRGRRAPAVPG